MALKLVDLLLKETPAKGGTASCYIGPDVRMSGTLRFKGVCLVHGTLEGKVESEGLLDVSPTGRVDAEAEVGEFVCRGWMGGSVTALRRADLLAGSLVEGALTTASIKVEEGAVLRGPIITIRPDGRPWPSTGFRPSATLFGRLWGKTAAAAVAGLLTVSLAVWLLSRPGSAPTPAPYPPIKLLAAAEEAVEQKDYDRAWNLYRAAYGTQPRNEKVLLGLANVAFVQGRRADAIENYERALELSPEHTAVQRRLGDLYALEGDTERALSHYQSVLEKSPEDENVLLAAARLQEKAGDLPRAMASYEKLRKLDPRREEVRVRLAALYARQGQLQRSIQAYSELLADRSDDTDLKLALARVFEKAREEERAAELFAEVAEKEPQRTEALRSAADIYLKLGENAKAMKALEASLRARPDDVDLRLTVSELYRLQGNHAKAFQHLRAVLDKDPANLQAALGVAETLLAKGQREEALERLQKVVEAHPEVAEAHYLTGQVLYEQKKTDEARASLLQALKLKPDHAEALNRLAWMYALEGDKLDEAVELSKKSLEIEPDSPVFLDTMAEIRYQRREYNEAIRLIRKAIDQAPQKEYYQKQLAKFQKAASRAPSGG